MKNIFAIIAAVVVGGLVFQQLFGRKHIISREDDPSIPPPATSSF